MAFSSRLEISVDARSGERNLKRFDGQLANTERRGESLASSMGGLTRIFGLAAAAAGGLSFTRLIRETAGFEDSMLGLQAVSGATTSQMQELEKQARTLGATSMFSAQQAGDAQRFLAMAGFEVNEVLSATPGILQLAAAGQMDLAQAADIASNVLGGMRLEVDQLSRVNNVLAATAAGSNTSITQLGQALSFAAPFAAAAGIEIEEAAAAIGTLSDSGLQASRAGTGLVGVIRQLSRVTPNARATLAEYGLTVDDVNIEAHGLTTVLDRLRQANLSTGAAFEIFGSEAGAAAQILANGSGRVRDFTGELNDAEGAAQRAAQIIGSGLTGSMRSFGSMLSETIISLGRDQGVAGGFQAVIDTASGVLAVYNDMLPEFAEANGLTEQQARNLQLLGGGLSTVATVAAGAAGGLAAYRGALMTATAAQWAFNTAVRANPIGLIITAAGAAVGALSALSNQLDQSAERAANMEFRANELAESLKAMGEQSIRMQLAAVTLELSQMDGALEALQEQSRRSSRTNSVLGADFRNLHDTIQTTVTAARHSSDEHQKLRTQQLALEKALNLLESTTDRAGNELREFNGLLGDTSELSKEAKREAERFANTLQALQDQLFPVEAAQRLYREEQAILTRAWNEGTISADRYTEAMRRLEQAQLSTQTPGSAYGGPGFGSQIGDPRTGMGVDREREQEGYWERWLESASEAFTDFDQMAANTAESFQRGFGNAFESMIFDSASAGDAARTMFEGISRTAVNALGQMAGQWLAYQAVQMATGRSMEAAAIAGAATTGTAIASAYAPAATMASLASFGANSAPAMAGISSTFALSKSLALAGMAHDGIDRIPREGTWLLDRGERVMNRPQADRLDRYLDQQEGKGGSRDAPPPVINIIHEGNTEAVTDQRQDDDGRWVIDVLIADIAGDGKFARAQERTYGLRRQGR